MTEPSQERRAELSEHWQSLSQRVAGAARAAGRNPREITLIAVTKTWPASDIIALRDLGIYEVGENRVQELATKLDAVAGVQWHFIGQLQRNKAALVARSCVALHTLDRAALIHPLSVAAAGAGRRLEVFIQLSLDGDPQRGGVGAADIEPLADLVAADPHLLLLGLMTVPPLGSDPAQGFAKLRAMSEKLLRSHPEAAALSAGMSNDFEIAVREGATHLRVGTVLMGSRD
jgi:PLP dependent protein